MIVVNNSANKPNWTQLKDRVEPLASCNVCACVNAAQAAGYDVMAARKMGEERPGDDLLEFIRSDPDCLQLWAVLDPGKSNPANQWMPVLALGCARWLGLPNAFKFDNNSNPLIMAQWIIAGGACVVSGHYPAIRNDGSPSVIDHITALVGLGYIDMGAAGIAVQYWIMDDSYGDYRTKYMTKFGDNINMPKADFDTYLKEVGSVTKRCIFIPKKGA